MMYLVTALDKMGLSLTKFHGTGLVRSDNNLLVVAYRRSNTNTDTIVINKFLNVTSSQKLLTLTI